MDNARDIARMVVEPEGMACLRRRKPVLSRYRSCHGTQTWMSKCPNRQ